MYKFLFRIFFVVVFFFLAFLIVGKTQKPTYAAFCNIYMVGGLAEIDKGAVLEIQTDLPAGTTFTFTVTPPDGRFWTYDVTVWTFDLDREDNSPADNEWLLWFDKQYPAGTWNVAAQAPGLLCNFPESPPDLTVWQVPVVPARVFDCKYDFTPKNTLRNALNVPVSITATGLDPSLTYYAFINSVGIPAETIAPNNGFTGQMSHTYTVTINEVKDGYREFRVHVGTLRGGTGGTACTPITTEIINIVENCNQSVVSPLPHQKNTDLTVLLSNLLSSMDYTIHIAGPDSVYDKTLPAGTRQDFDNEYVVIPGKVFSKAGIYYMTTWPYACLPTPLEITVDINPIKGGNPCKQPDGTIKCNTALGWINPSSGEFASRILTIATGLAGGIALILMVIGAIRVAMSSGDQQKLAGGREMIIAAVAGLLFIVFAIIIFRFIAINLLGIPGFG